MDAREQIEKFEEFFKTSYSNVISKIALSGKKSFILDFQELAKYDHELAEELINQPEETLKAAELALDDFNISKELKVRIRFLNLPKSQIIMIKDIRFDDLNKFIAIEGIVRQASDVRPQVTFAKFECPACGNIITIPQLDTKFREPYRCSCGRKGRFRLLNKELVDVQRLVLEEAPESLEGGEQPKKLQVFLREDLVEPKMEKKTTPGSKIRIFGIIKEIPIPMASGAQSVRYDLGMDANFIEPIEETFEELEINETDEEEIKKLALDPRIYEKLIRSVAPSIYGHENIKEALVLQLFGGVKKSKPDGTKIRGDTHLLLVGDPGCIAGDSQVALLYKGMEKIQNLGNKHLQQIRIPITKIRRNAQDRAYDFATVFHHYHQQPVLKVVTETGKQVICTYNQPFLTKEGWERADELLVGTKIRVMPKIPNKVKELFPTGFVRTKKSFGPLKEVSLPNKVTPELASLYGYIIGDGNIHKNGYKVTCYINDEEKDIIPQLSELLKKTFNIPHAIHTKMANGAVKTITDRNGLLRQFISTQQIHLLEINSKQVTQSLSFLHTKRVPQQIFKSPNSVVAKFISWLFEADGCAFGNGRGRTAIQLKSINIDLLRDVQLLLLYFGIQSRIVENNLCIRRSHDMELFAKYIGFNSEKKKVAINKVLEVIKNRSEIQKRKPNQRYEKVIELSSAGVMDVYDFEVPLSKSFIANGIVCHNSAKTTLLTAISKLAPKSRFVAGKGISAAGITATVVKDEFLRGWALEAGALVLANRGLLCLHPKTEIIFDNRIKKIEELFDEKKAKLGKQGNELVEYHELKNDTPTLKLNSLDMINSNVSKIRRKKYSGKLLKINFKSGFSIKLTPDHKLLDGNSLEWKESQKFSVKEKIIAPLKLPENNKDIYILDILPDDWKVVLNKDQKQEIKLLIKKEFKTLSEFNKKFNLSRHYLSGGKQLHIKIFRDILNYFNNYDEWKKIPLKYCRKHAGEILKIAKVTPELGYILGFLYGDGCIKVSKRRTKISLVQSLKHQIYINQFNKCWDKVFFKKMGYVIQKSTSNIRGRKFTSISKQMYKGSNLLGKLSEILLGKNLSNLLRLDNQILSAFIAGVMDSDGCISNKQCSKNNKTYIIQHIDFMFAPKRIEDNLNFILILRKLDCYGKLIQQKAGYLVEITGRTDVKTLKEKIQKYSIKFAQKKILNKITNISSISQKIPSKIVSILCQDISKMSNKSILISKGIWSTIYSYKKQKIQPSRDQLLKIKNKLILPNDICRQIDQLIKRDYFLDEIVSIKEEDYEGYVYDLFVPQTNNFIANGIIVHNCLDELDKVREEDTAALHEAMESQIISIAKASIQATLRAETTILAAANPKYGRFDPTQSIAKQINLPPTLINRFDLIFTVKDMPKRDTDEKIAKHILEIQQKPEIIEMEINPKLLKKYISYAKQKINPKLSDGAIEEIKTFYVDLRNIETFGVDQMIKPIPITARQLEALVRLAEASARIQLRKTVTRNDAKRSITLLKNCLLQVGLDVETGLIDIDKIATGITASQRSKILTIREIINELNLKGKKDIAIEEIISIAQEKNIDSSAVEEAIDRLRREGEIFEPKHGWIRKT